MADSYQQVVQNILAENFTISGRELMIGGVAISELASEFGTPLYIYDAAIIRRKLRELREATPGFHCFYSVKANPNPSIIRLLLDAGCGLEIASEGELELALACGCEAQNILFAGPGKTDHELGRAVAAGVAEIHVESLQEVARLGKIAAAQNRTVPIALRVNPASLTQGAAQQMGGRATAFGIDEEILDQALAAIATEKNLLLTGLHVFAGTQNLNASGFENLYGRIIEMAKRVVATTKQPLRTIDFGGGFGVPYFSGDAPLDLTVLKQSVSKVVAPLKETPEFKDTKFIVEPGRYLTAESGIYVTRVTTTKTSRGTRFAVLDGGLSQHLPASGQFGQVVKRNFPITVANRIGEDSPLNHELVGPLCTPLDVVGRNLLLPELAVGDIVVILQSGAYARTTSPLGFLSHHEPMELMVDNKKASVIRKKGDFAVLARGTYLDRKPC